MFDLTSDRNRYYEGEFFSLHVALVQPTPGALLLQEGCPTLYLREKSPDGASRIDEEQPMAFKGCRAFVPGYEPGDWQSGFELNSGANSRWVGLGEHTFEVLKLVGSLDDPELHFVISNILRVQIEDPSLIPRNWGPRTRGVAVDITLDRDTFQIGENIPLHLAVKNFDAESPVYGLAECGIVRIEVQDATGHPLAYNERDSGISFCSGHSFGLIPYVKGNIVPLELTLRAEGWLPNHTGTYTVTATWPVWDQAFGGTITEAPYSIARATRTIHIVGRDAPNLK
jgi:hypothetical protein